MALPSLSTGCFEGLLAVFFHKPDNCIQDLLDDTSNQSVFQRWSKGPLCMIHEGQLPAYDCVVLQVQYL